MNKVVIQSTLHRNENNQGNPIGRFIHPLLHKKTSTSGELTYTTIFKGNEFFLSDHIVKKKRTLPGVAYLEMARAALEKSGFIPLTSNKSIELRNVIWAYPITVDKEPLKVNIRLQKEKNGDYSYSIYSMSGNDLIEYSQGMARSVLNGDMDLLDIDTLKKQCDVMHISPDKCYDIFESMGVIYGSNLRGIEEIYLGNDQILSKLSLPQSIQDTQSQYFLHPCMMDSALQGSVSFLLGSDNIKSALPFALRSLSIIRECPSSAWSLIRYSKKQVDRINRNSFDIIICDDNGRICIKMEGLIAQEFINIKDNKSDKLINDAPPENIELNISLTETTDLKENIQNIEKRIEEDLKTQVAEIAEVPEEEIDTDENILNYGFDSFKLAKLASSLTKHYSIVITPSIFFGYTTIRELSCFYLDEHEIAIKEFYKLHKESRFPSGDKHRSSSSKKSDEIAVVADQIEKEIDIALAEGSDSKGSLQNINERIEDDLKCKVAEIAEVPEEEIDTDENILNYGFDSFKLAKLASSLTKHYSIVITPSIFFGYTTIRELSCFYLDEHEIAIKEFYKLHKESRLPSGDKHRSSSLKKSEIVVVADQIEKEIDIALAEGSDSEESTKNIKERLEKDLRIQVAEIAEIPEEEIDSDENILNYGFDSFKLAKLASTLTKHYDIVITPSIFFGYTTIKELSGFYHEEYGENLKGFYSEDANLRQKMEKKHKSHSAVKSGEEINSLKYEKKLYKRNNESIAIVGMSGRFPMADDLDEFWKNLLEGRDCIQEIPKERWDWKEYYGDPQTEDNKTNIKWGGFIDGIDEFDPLFFNISPNEASLMDPQQRLLMMYVWKAIEDAGYSAKDLSGTQTGIFVGTATHEYNGMIPKFKSNQYPQGVIPSVGPNRMSYFLNIHGPSEPIETACSSSLVAIHRGVEALKNKVCDMMIAGGVNTILTPSDYIKCNKLGMFSEDGRCKTFSDKANGYGRGEGVGMLLMKRLSDAEKAGDHIYGIICSSSENHGGRSSSLTSPNPKAQAALLKDAYLKAGIDPRSIGYIEMHGTGTKIGDSIEVNGLKNAFHELNDKACDSKIKNIRCGLGSVKSNIGHLELAAGIAGVFKVLLQIKNKTLVKSLHCDSVNPYIQLDNSPFYIVRENEIWESLSDSMGNELPLRAGISSFGIGGANAHIVIEEYVPKSIENSISINDDVSDPFIVVLSARNEKRLLDQARQLLLSIKKNKYNNSQMMDIAYTLQVGRDAMKERLAIIVKSIDELESKLMNFVDGDGSRDGVYRGKVVNKSDHDTVSSKIDEFATDENVERIAKYWVKGVEYDWIKLYNKNKPKRISLPTYPFARDRYWLPKTEKSNEENDVITKFHPLLHKNTSDLSLQKFSSTFTGNEIFFAGHIVNGKKTLPGVAYLEMAQTAAKNSFDLVESSGIRLKNIVWNKPIVIDNKPIDVHIALIPEDKSKIFYEVYVDTVDRSNDKLKCSQGMVEFIDSPETPKINLDMLKKQCSRNELSSESCYKVFKDMGFDYGDAYQGITKIYIGENQVLAQITLPPALEDTKRMYDLHPSILDSAFQASIGILAGADATLEQLHTNTFVPFALQYLEILGQCSSKMWAHIKPGKENKQNGKIKYIDIDLCDEQGKVCIRIKGLCSRPIKNDENIIPNRIALTDTLLFSPAWKEMPVTTFEVSKSEYMKHIVFICNGNEDLNEYLENELNDITLFSYRYDDDISKAFQDCSIRILEIIKNILLEKPQNNVFIQIITSGHGDNQLFSGLSGILKTAHLENSKIIGQVIVLDEIKDRKEIKEKILENSKYPTNNQVRYNGGKRFVMTLDNFIPESMERKIPWKNKGVYLITGGAGALGQIFVKEIVKKTSGVKIIVTGRSQLDKKIENDLDNLEVSGSVIEYRQADVSKIHEVESLVQYIKQKYESLDGIIHGAGIIKDNYIINKTGKDFEDIFAPKVHGLINLDKITKNIPLDFFIIFSSCTGVIGNAGQADYAAANAFCDKYAEYRNSLVKYDKRYGHTVSINWPLWRKGGMQVDAEKEKQLIISSGVVPMETDTGILSLYNCFNSGFSQVMVMEGDIVRIKEKLNVTNINPDQSSDKVFVKNVFTETDINNIADDLHKALMGIVSDILNLKLEDIDVDTELNEYGFDSVTFTKLVNDINEYLNLELAPTIFFEYSTLNEFTYFLINEFKEKLSDKFPKVSHNKNTSPKINEMEIIVKNDKHSRVANEMTDASKNKTDSILEPIAIVGISGRFPMAKDIDELWKNLLEGKDCITEIPNERWDWRNYYGDPGTEVNKTNIRWGGFIDGIDQFDPAFFGISPREAEYMDPRQRLVMLYIWKVLEDAGYSAKSLSGSNTGIFIATATSGYSDLIAKSNATIESFTSTGNVPSLAANRMSYFLNFHGPSEVIETACSSSLVTIHRAVESIVTGSCDMAIAGGVNTIIEPSGYIAFNKAGMLCEDGRCKTFSAEANGYVRGEGIGIILLKKLTDAEKSGDHIYGVIRSTAENHGGRSNSLTAPNPKAQSELLGTAYMKAEIDPRSVGYIETHGTGTKLGDPIEINGLKTAFDELYKECGDWKIIDKHCGLGSIKSNIGHLELAAGIAGVIKVLLQIKNQTLVKTLHCENINPYIQLDNSPFFILQENKKWCAIQDSFGNQLPRRAGVSSFGFGGTNAHVVIEEYIPKAENNKKIQTKINSYIILLSARDNERLKDRAQQLLEIIDDKEITDVDLGRVAYTLQVGRDQMEERLGAIVQTVDELKENLEAFIKDEENIEKLYYGKIKQKNEALKILNLDEDIQSAIDTWMLKGKYTKLLSLWVNGLEIDWNKLYGDQKPDRISLPTYPFAKDRYWIPERKDCSKQVNNINDNKIHPFLHTNISNLSAQQYRSTFTGSEIFLADHRVKGKKMLPGVACLEMARTALNDALNTDLGINSRIQIKDVVWIRPFIVNSHPVNVNIKIYPGENDEIFYEIYQELENAEDKEIIYSKGKAEIIHKKEKYYIDLDLLKSECMKSSLSSEQCYEIFKDTGIEYGPGLRGIKEIFIGENQVLAKLFIPSSLYEGKEKYFLHPTIMDSAIQAGIGLGMATDIGYQKETFVPFALKELEMFSQCTKSMWAYICYNSENDGEEDQHRKIDIVLCDDQGRVCVSMKGYSIRVLKEEIEINNIINYDLFNDLNKSISNTISLIPFWEATLVKDGGKKPSASDKIIIIGGNEKRKEAILEYYPNAVILEIMPDDTIDTITQNMEKIDKINHIFWMEPENKLKTPIDLAVIEEQKRGVIQIFRIIKSLLRLGYAFRELGWTLLTTNNQTIHRQDINNPIHASIHGLIGSMAKEFPNWTVRLIDIEKISDPPIEDLIYLPSDTNGEPWIYRRQEWYRQQLAPIKELSIYKEIYRTGGVYVIIGGAGGIGEVLSEYLIKNYQAHIIWIGRREKDTVIQEKIDRLKDFGPAPLYISADAGNNQSLLNAYGIIKEKYSDIHGVINSAIVLSDMSLMNMNEQTFNIGLYSKVDVSVTMARIFKNEKLDFVLFFSSVQSFTKAKGQSNYSAGCTFIDSFAQRLNKELPCPVKIMNWGYWGSIGVVSSRFYQGRMDKLGVGSIEPSEAMNALNFLMKGPMDQMLFMKITKPKVLEGMGISTEKINIYMEEYPSIIKDMKKNNSIPSYAIDDIQSIKVNSDIEYYLYRLLINQLKSLGCFNKGKSLAQEEKSLKVLKMYDRWLDESINMLFKTGYLTLDENNYHIIENESIDNESLWKEWENQKVFWSKDADMRANIDLVETTMKALPDILIGNKLATDIIFPDSSMELVEGIYKNNKIADYFNRALAKSVNIFIEESIQKNPDCKIRIIEVGAGTGGTSEVVLKSIKPYENNIEEYCYTDISRAFLIHGEKEYGELYQYLNCKIFNIEKTASDQKIATGAYDIVIATNVLHATKNIRNALRNLKSVLKKNGILILNEITSSTLFTHLTFGLLEGWWRYEDSAIRVPGCPGLSTDTWSYLLEQEGYRSVFSPIKSTKKINQEIIIAESDGVVREEYNNKINIATVIKKEVFENTDEKEIPLMPISEKKIDGDSKKILHEKCINYLKELISEAVKIPVNKIDPSSPFEVYGIDSIIVVQLITTLKKKFKNISSTIFFENKNIKELAKYFLISQRDTLIELFGSKDNKMINISSKKKNIYRSSLSLKDNTELHIRKMSRFSKQYKDESDQSITQTIEKQDIAVIGLSGRYPQANNINEFWTNIRNGKNCITEIPNERWDWRKYYNDKIGTDKTIYTKWGGFINDIDKFDPLFFNISPKEAEGMDPQERIFLEIAYSCCEDAGYIPQNLCENGKVGVFVGVMNGNYPTGSCYYSIANRVSYHLNLNGPSIAVDSACSSSLTAIHLAIESIYNGTSDCAIAGGVNFIIDPIHLMRLSALGMLSKSDKCKAFGDNADGFVAGEGVGAIILKPLKKAIKDKDNIYAIIKGSMINAGGKTNGYTVPNPNAQSQAISEAFRVSRIYPRSISYIEAHGTGTSLGDPIEIAGLNRAFEKYTDEKQFCAIGSVKSNIGHCESAAGIAGITKILMQLKYSQLVPSLHSKKLNTEINFSNTPFIIQQDLGQWERPTIEISNEIKEFPRIAGISSFGAGGSNAHIIIEEYIPKEKYSNSSIDINPHDPKIILLSAREDSQLKEQVYRLHEFLKIQNNDDINLNDIAYTLQVGRESMEKRVAFIVGTMDVLNEKLMKYINDEDDADIFRGKIKVINNLSIINSDEDITKTTDAWIANKEYRKIVDYWVRGNDIDWNKLYIFNERIPRRISLPTYPFAKERYWVPETENTLNLKKYGRTVIHPLLHENVSDLTVQKYTSRFTGKETFLSDHIVNKRKVLPAVAYLEMAYTALESASGSKQSEGIRLMDVFWSSPLWVDNNPVDLNISLIPEKDGEVSYEIYTNNKGSEENMVVHHQGKAVLSSTPDNRLLSITELKSECNREKITSIQCYEAFDLIGINYGPSHRGIEELYIGENKVLAKIKLPDIVMTTKNQYVLHPCVMDSALQASIGLDLLTAQDSKNKPVLPFAMDELLVIGKCEPNMWAYIRYSDSLKVKDNIRKVDIDLCDENGKVCVEIRGFSSMVLNDDTSKKENTAENEIMILKSCWKEREILNTEKYLEYGTHVVVVCKGVEISKKQLEQEIAGVNCILLKPEQGGLAEEFQSYSVQLFEKIRDILKNKSSEDVLIQVLITGQEEQSVLFGLSGLLKTSHLENPKIKGQVIGVEQDEAPEKIISVLRENSILSNDDVVRYKNGKREVIDLDEVDVENSEESKPWKDRGVYLITGGLGGLGKIFAKEILLKTEVVTLILTGRSRLDERKQVYLKDLNISGATVEYIQIDVTNKEDVSALIRDIVKKYGSLDGIIHSAGIVKDNFIIKKNKDEFNNVLSPKVSGLVNLDEVTSNLNLDIFILFSSNASSFGNTGQSDYSTANAFMDYYAAYRNNLVELGKRNGHTLSINWPLWKEGNMNTDEEIKTMMKDKIGIVPMETERGILALYKGISSGESQVIVMDGDLERLRKRLLKNQKEIDSMKIDDCDNKSKEHIIVVDDRLREKALDYFKRLLSLVIKLPVHRIDIHALFERYGINSIMILKMTNELEKTFGALPKTLFFEYPDIKKLTEYFIENYRELLIELVGINKNDGGINQIYDETELVTEPLKVSKRPRKKSRFKSASSEIIATEKSGAIDIAIIGLSGRYPKANNIHEFYENLIEGKDCITEIPKERWDYNIYFDEDKDKKGKIYSKWGGFIDNVDKFDPVFFNISPREAAFIDPQERIFLECVYEVVEDAGYTGESLGVLQNSGGNVGVYAGVMYSDYQLYGVQMQNDGKNIALSGNASSISNRISYFFNFNGPSITIDTMCSSSLTAIHLACNSIRLGECDVAIAGGVNLTIHPNKYLMLSQGKFLSSNGRCKSFGREGDGYVPGEGVGAVMLKPLSNAIADGDNIYGVIKGTSINHGGKTNGYSVPNPNAQADVIRSVYIKSGVDPRTISYIEAHGTGTSLGDPIEIAGLEKVFNEDGKEKQYCAIGTVKSNIGHCESAAGIAGLTKVLLQLKHKQLFPSLHSKKLNPNIDFQNSSFIVQQNLTEWKRPIVKIDGEEKEYPRRAGVSSFGAGGSNVHIVIEEYNSGIDEKGHSLLKVDSSTPSIILLSAKNKEKLKEQAERLIESVKKQNYSDSDLVDIAFTLQVCREAMEERLAILVHTINELNMKLGSFIEGKEDITDLYHGHYKSHRELVSVFKNDIDMNGLIEAWMIKGKYSKLLSLWVKGVDISWGIIYKDKKPRRVSLPTYPFTRKKYWIHEIESVTGEDSESSAINQLLVENRSDGECEKINLNIAEDEIFSKEDVIKSDGVTSNYPREKISLNPLPSDRLKNNNSDNSDNNKSQHSKINLPLPKSDDIGKVNVKPKNKNIKLNNEYIMEALRSGLADILFMEKMEIDEDKTFFDMGMDSIIGVEWIKSINKKYNTSIEAAKLYDYPTIRKFTAFLKQELNAQNEIDNDDSSEQTQILSMDEVLLRDQQGNILVEEADDIGKVNAKPKNKNIKLNNEYIMEALRSGLADILFMEKMEIDEDKTFFDMGMDSIIGVEWIKSINKKYNTSIEAATLYDYPTIRKFTAFLKQELNAQNEIGNVDLSEQTQMLSMDELLLHVQQGNILVEEADQLLNKIVNQGGKNEQRSHF